MANIIKGDGVRTQFIKGELPAPGGAGGSAWVGAGAGGVGSRGKGLPRASVSAGAAS